MILRTANGTCQSEDRQAGLPSAKFGQMARHRILISAPHCSIDFATPI